MTIQFLLCILTAKAQEAIVISGIVRDAKTHDALDAVNIMLQSADGKLMHGFALTNEQGNYSIKYINLQMKSTSSGIWNGSAQAGLGYKPAIWDVEATAIYFGRKFQNLSLYKTNNIGNDISGELTSHYSDDEEDGLPILSGIHKPKNVCKTFSENLHLLERNKTFHEKNKMKFRLNYIPYTTFTNYPKGCITEENRIPYSAILQGSLLVVVYTDSSRRMEHTL